MKYFDIILKKRLTSIKIGYRLKITEEKKSRLQGATKTGGFIMTTRIDTFFEELRTEMTDHEIAAALGNGDISTPGWLCMAESTDHVKVWDDESGASSQMGFTTFSYKNTDSIEAIEDAASSLKYDWIVLDALQEDLNPDVKSYLEVVEKIADIEAKYTEAEITENNLLVDIW